MLDIADPEPTPTEYVVHCPNHKHYLVHVGATGTSWTDDRAKAKGYTKRQAIAAAEQATWLDHNPTPWAIAMREPNETATK